MGIKSQVIKCNAFMVSPGSMSDTVTRKAVNFLDGIASVQLVILFRAQHSGERDVNKPNEGFIWLSRHVGCLSIRKKLSKRMVIRMSIQP